MLETMIAYVLAAMTLAWSLTSKLMGPVPKDIASAIATASAEKPIFEGEVGARKTAMLMTSTGRYESGFRQVAGDCKGKPPGWPGCGKQETADHPPTSFCFLQVHFEDGVEKVEGYTREELMTDPLKCARAGREIMRRSALKDPGQPLKGYAGGDVSAASKRWELAKKLFLLVPWQPRCD